jgi:MoxR-like ATPase
VRYSQVFGATAITNGDTHWELSPFLQAVQKPGVVLLDEIFSAEPDILLGLNSLLEPSSREIMTPAGRIAVHAECCFVAAANTNGRGNSRQYTGAGRADDSTLSRFSAKVKVNVDPLVESNLIAHSSLERKDKTWVKEKITSLRQALTLHNIPFDLGTRELISLLNIMATGIDREIALDLAILNSLSVTERKTLGDFGRL